MHNIKYLKNLHREIRIPPDKSISHRVLIISSLCRNEVFAGPLLLSDDVLATADCLKKTGVHIKFTKGGCASIKGSGMYLPRKQRVVLSARESGTTMRILSGLLSAQKFPSELKGAPSLSRRPMGRVVYPLREMNARIGGREITEDSGKTEIYPPLSIEPTDSLKGRVFDLSVPSAQVKSAIILAALYSRRKTVINELHKTRDHTERLLSLFKAGINTRGKRIVCHPCGGLKGPGRLSVPADFSSASFFIVLGALLKNSEFTIKGVNINPSRCGLLEVLKRMGAKIRIMNRSKDYEPAGDILVKSSNLNSTSVCEKEIPLMIDEIPVLCVAASFAKGRTLIKGVRELKVKETDRIASMVYNLKRAGVNIEARRYKVRQGKKENWLLSIEGGSLRKADFKSFSDHRTAMSMIVFGSAAGRGYSIDELRCVRKSFPEFVDLIELLGR